VALENDALCDFSDSTVSCATQSLHGASIRMTELQGSYKIFVLLLLMWSIGYWEMSVLYWIVYTVFVNTESWNHLGWKRPFRSLSPTINKC